MEEKQSKNGWILSAFLAVVLGGSMVVLFVVLVTASNAGEEAIAKYLSSIRTGAAVAEEIAGAEANSLTGELHQSTSFSISNFQSQANTSCFWVTLEGAQELEARFVLAERGDEMVVTAASSKRECDCPIDFDLPCHLK